MVLKGRERHELSCSACGAPLHNLKMLRKEKAPEPVRPRVATPPPTMAKRKKVKKVKRRKGVMARFLDEAWDVVEDIFD
nr:hypothetical protein [Ruegeria sp. HKCCD8929]